MSYHGNGLAFCKEVFHSFCLDKLVDGTPLNENVALAAMIMNKRYVGICYTEFHAHKLYERLQERVFTGLTDETIEGIYEPTAVADVMVDTEEVAAKKPKHGTGPPQVLQPKVEAKPAPKPKATPKSKAGANAKAGAGDSVASKQLAAILASIETFEGEEGELGGTA